MIGVDEKISVNDLIDVPGMINVGGLHVPCIAALSAPIDVPSSPWVHVPCTAGVSAPVTAAIDVPCLHAPYTGT
jgi:hypothetical protein